MICGVGNRKKSELLAEDVRIMGQAYTDILTEPAHPGDGHCCRQPTRHPQEIPMVY